MITATSCIRESIHALAEYLDLYSVCQLRTNQEAYECTYEPKRQ